MAKRKTKLRAVPDLAKEEKLTRQVADLFVKDLRRVANDLAKHPMKAFAFVAIDENGEQYLTRWRHDPKSRLALVGAVKVLADTCSKPFVENDTK